MRKNKNTKPKYDRKVALALGGGGARGFAHVGILEVLEEEGVELSYMAGTSMGAIIGGMYAIGMSLKKIKAIALNFKNVDLSPSKHLNLMHESLLKGDYIEQGLNEIFGGKSFSDCKIPFLTTAVDLESGKEVVFGKGSLKSAIMASVSMPIIFPPTFYQDRYLVDGGILNNVPLDCLRKLNPDILIGSEIYNYASRQYISGFVFEMYHKYKYAELFNKGNILKKLFQKRIHNVHFLALIALRALDIAARDSTELRMKKARPDILLKPNIQCGLLEFDRAQEAINEGRRSMREAMPQLIKLLKKRSG